MSDERDLIPGTRYKVSFNDCCVGGHFTGVFERLVVDDEGHIESAVFDTGETSPPWDGGSHGMDYVVIE